MMEQPRAPCLLSACRNLLAFCAAAAIFPTEGATYVNYTADFLQNIDGGVKQGGQYIDYLEMGMEGAPSPQTRAALRLIYGNGAEFSGRLVGDLQGVSNIESVSGLRLYELWTEWTSNHTATRVGVMDLNATFDTLAPAQLFLNGSHGIGAELGQSGINGPSTFPATTLGVQHEYRTQGRWSYVGGLFDAEPGDALDPSSRRIDPGGGVLGIAEFRRAGETTRLSGGYWRYSSAIARSSGMAQSGHEGFYVGVETSLGRLNGFVRAGTSARGFHPFASYAGAGLVHENASRRCGVGVAMGFVDPQFRRETERQARETSIEITCAFVLNGNAEVQLDMQRIINPMQQTGTPDATVLALRFDFSLSR